MRYTALMGHSSKTNPFRAILSNIFFTHDPRRLLARNWQTLEVVLNISMRSSMSGDRKTSVERAWKMYFGHIMLSLDQKCINLLTQIIAISLCTVSFTSSTVLLFTLSIELLTSTQLRLSSTVTLVISTMKLR